MKKFFVFALTLMAGAINMFAQECVETDINLPGTASITFSRIPHEILTGVFSIAEDKHVIFSQGNLQYNAALGTHTCSDETNKPGTWRFAEYQWTRMSGNNRNIAEDYNGWIDLFGWGTSGYNRGVTAYQPWASSTEPSDYHTAEDDASSLTEYSDWAQYNTILNGGVSDGGWSVLTLAEWQYLFSGRANAANLICFGTLVNIPGIFLLPDGWVDTKEVTITTQSGSKVTNTVGYFMGLASFSWTTYVSGNYATSHKESNLIARDNDVSKDLWTALEASGVVFLPAAMLRNGTSLSNSTSGYYWTATARSDKGYARHIYFKVGSDSSDNTATLFYGIESTSRALGHSVRPVYRLD